MFLKLRNHLLNKEEIAWVQYQPAKGGEQSVLRVHLAGASIIQVFFKGDEADVMWKELCQRANKRLMRFVVKDRAAAQRTEEEDSM